jgi:hypothetical protein
LIFLFLFSLRQDIKLFVDKVVQESTDDRQRSLKPEFGVFLPFGLRQSLGKSKSLTGQY